MSLDAARAFLDMATGDPRTARKLQARLARSPDPAREVVELAADLGYDFTTEEFARARSDFALSSGELADEALESAAGGIIAVLIGMKRPETGGSVRPADSGPADERGLTEGGLL